jgi:hypothetical protein
VPPASQKINYASSIFLCGSCFSENIGIRLKNYKFNTLINPLGIIYNPASIVRMIERLLRKEFFNEEELLNQNGKWYSIEHHGQFSGNDVGELLDRINNTLETGNQALMRSTHLILTLGTAKVYELKESGRIVANCHKLPQKYFGHRILNVPEVSGILGRLAELLNSELPDINIIFSISPVRHWRDGAIENQLSKSVLHVSVRDAISKNSNCTYFPAYELMMDDLRDYRFYDRDMLHPSPVAIDYIWKHFKKSNLDTTCYDEMEEIDKLQKMMQHRLISKDVVENNHFFHLILEKLHILEKRFPSLDFQAEKEAILKRMAENI